MIESEPIIWLLQKYASFDTKRLVPLLPQQHATIIIRSLVFVTKKQNNHPFAILMIYKLKTNLATEQWLQLGNNFRACHIRKKKLGEKEAYQRRLLTLELVLHKL